MPESNKIKITQIKRENSLSRLWSNGLNSLSRVFSSFSSVQIIPSFTQTSRKHTHTLNINPNNNNNNFINNDSSPNIIQSSIDSEKSNSNSSSINYNNVDEIVRLTVKRKPSASKGISTSLEDELYLFVLDISIDTLIDVSDDRLYFLSSDFPLYLMYSSERTKNRNQSVNNMSNTVSSPYELISLLRNSAVIFMNNKTTIHENNSSNPFLINIRGESGASYLVAATKSLSKLLGEYDEYNHKEIEENSLDGGSCFCSIDNALMVADIFVLASIRLLTDSLIETSIMWNESLNHRVSSFLQSVLHVGNSANVGESTTIKFLWCQLILRCCRLILVIVETMIANDSFYTSSLVISTSSPPKPNHQINNQYNNNFVSSPNSSINNNNNHFTSPNFQHNNNNNTGMNSNHPIKPLSDLVNAIQTLCSCVNLVKVFSGATSSGYYAVTVIYWECCRSVIKLIKMFDSNEETMKQVKSTLVMLHSRSFNSLHMTAPSLQELHYEVNSIAAFKYTLNSTFIDDRKLINILRSYKHSSIVKSLAAILDNDNEDDDRSLGSSLSLSTISGGETDKSPQFSFRMRILFTGLVNLLSLPDIKNSSALSIPEKNDWIGAIAEFLLVILSQQNQSSNRKQNRHSERRISDLIHLAPYVAKILLNTIFGWTLPSSIDWMFWAFAKRLGGFSEYLRKNLNSSFKTQSINEVNSRIVKTRNNNKTSSSPKSESDSNGFNGKYFQKNSKRESPAKNVYQIGNSVDALCVVQNGSKRWYPGTITSVTLDGFYQIQFLDGDIRNNISVSDMRFTKKRSINSAVAMPVLNSANLKNEEYLTRVEAVPTSPENTNIHIISEKIGRSLSQLDDMENKLEDKGFKNSSGSLSDSLEESVTENKIVSKKIVKSKSREPSYRNPTATSRTKVNGKTNKQESSSDNLFNRNNKNEGDSRLNLTSKSELATDDMSVKSIQSDNLDENVDYLSENNSDNDGSDVDDDRIFTIPSVFQTVNSEGCEEQVVRTTTVTEVVPKMIFEDMNVSASLAHSSSNLSLSGALLSDNNFNLNLNTQRIPDLSSRLLSQSNSHRSFTLMDGNNSSRSNINQRKNTIPKHNLLQGIGTLQDDYDQAPINTGDATRTKSYNVNDERNNTERTANFMNAPNGKRKSKKSSNSSFHRHQDDDIAFDKSLLQSLLNTYGIITVVLLQRCISDGEFLDYSCCVSSDFSSPRSIESQSVNAVQSNVLYNVREFLEISSLYKHNSPEKLNMSAHIAELLNQSNPSTLRLIKLLSPDYFVNCLSEHLKSGIKIGEGGFGTVFNVTCPAECGKFRRYYNCLSCYKQEVCEIYSSGDLNSKHCHCGSSRYTKTKNSFAIKRIPRERSPFDNPLIYDLYNEIQSLEILNGTIGVCCLEDFGISGSEYWLVMEKGGQNLSEWRHQIQDDLKESSFRTNNSSLDSLRIYLLLSIYLDTCFILKSIHAADIVHFDIKCNNFILRDDPEKYFKTMIDSHRKGLPSGLICLADFGESVPSISKQRTHPHKLRCRGTITIQSPEMLCVSDSLSSSMSVNSAWKKYEFNVGVNDDGSFQEKVPPLNNQFFQNSSKKQSQKNNIRKLFQTPTKSSDIWSMGCLLVELLTDQQLFSDRTWTDMYVTLCMEKFIQIPLDCLFLALNSLDIKIINQIETIVTSALQQDPDDRVSLEQLISDLSNIIEVNFTKELVTSLNNQKNNKINKSESNKTHGRFEFIRKTSSSRNKEIRNRFFELKNQLVKLDYQMLTIGEVKISFESTTKVIKYFDNILRSHIPLTINDSDDISSSNCLQFDILKKIGSIDDLILSCNMSTVCSHIGKLVLNNKISPHHNFTWIRIISNKIGNNNTLNTNKDLINSSQEEEFESFLKNSKKDWKTFVLSLNSVSFDSDGSTEKVISAVYDIVKHLISLNPVNPMKNVLISLDPIEISDDDVDELNGVILLNNNNNNTNNKDFNESRWKKVTSEVFYNRQSLIVVEAISSVLFYFDKNQSNKINKIIIPTSQNSNNYTNNKVNLPLLSIIENNNKIVTPLRKLIPCLEMEFDPEIVDYIVHAVIYKLLH